MKFNAKDVVKLFLKQVAKHWGLPKSNVSDRDLRSMGQFWIDLFDMTSSALFFLTSFHPQTDEQIKRVNALLEIDLWYFVSVNQTNWEVFLEVA